MTSPKRKVGNTIAARDFKQHCLQLIEAVCRRRISITITKRGVPIAKLVPLDSSDTTADSFGSLRGTVTYHGDIVAPHSDEWPDDG